MKQVKMDYSTLYCTICNAKMIVPRKRNRRREKGHVKTMYCISCKDLKDFKETGEYIWVEQESWPSAFLPF